MTLVTLVARVPLVVWTPLVTLDDRIRDSINDSVHDNINDIISDNVHGSLSGDIIDNTGDTAYDNTNENMNDNLSGNINENINGNIDDNNGSSISRLIGWSMYWHFDFKFSPRWLSICHLPFNGQRRGIAHAKPHPWRRRPGKWHLCQLNFTRHRSAIKGPSQKLLSL